MKTLRERFLDEPRRQFHVRELAKIARLAPSTVSRQLTALATKGFLLREDAHGRSFFRLNNDTPIVRNEKVAHNVQRLHACGLVAHLIEACNEPEAIILFGSYGRGEENERSDVDLAIIGPKHVQIDLSTYERKLKRQIQLLFFSRDELARLRRDNKELLNNLVNGRIIHGYWVVF